MFNPRERHYKFSDLARCWNVSYDVVRDLFRNRRGVLRIRTPRKGKRSYTTYRVPESLANKVYDELTQGYGERISLPGGVSAYRISERANGSKFFRQQGGN